MEKNETKQKRKRCEAQKKKNGKKRDVSEKEYGWGAKEGK